MASDMSKAGSSSVRSSVSRMARMRSCAVSSMGEPQTTISGSPMSTSHQRVARHLAATSWLTRWLPMKKISGSPLEPVLNRQPCIVGGHLGAGTIWLAEEGGRAGPARC